MFCRKPSARWQRTRLIIVSALLPALTLAGAPVGACCCGFGGRACGCIVDAGFGRSIDSRVPEAPASDSSNRMRPCCRQGQGNCPRCCGRCRSNLSSSSENSSGRSAVVAQRGSGRAEAADCGGRTPTTGERSRPKHCGCAMRADLDVPRQASPLLELGSQVFAFLQRDVCWTDRLPGNDLRARWSAPDNPRSCADHVIALCRLLI
jgi:hypothetical protein